MTAISVTVEPPGDVEALGAVWRELETRSDAHFFLTWHWVGCWLASVAARPWLLVARDGKRVVGLGLLGFAVERRHRVLKVPTLYLNESGDPAQDVVTIEFNDVLADRALAPAVRRACLERLLATRRVGKRRVDALVWRGAEQDLAEGALAGFGRPWRHLAEAPSAAVDLAAVRASGRPFLAHLSANTRQQIRRSVALYERRGGLRLEAARDVGEALRFFRAAGVLHQARWTPRGEPGAFARPFYVHFHGRVIAAGLPAGAVEVVRVSAGEEPFGYLYNFLHRGRAYHYFSGFRYEADNRLKPGLVSHALCVERHLARGMDVYDFMAGDNRYKTSLGQPGPRMIAVAIERPTPLLRLESLLRRLKGRLAERSPSQRAPASQVHARL